MLKSSQKPPEKGSKKLLKIVLKIPKLANIPKKIPKNSISEPRSAKPTHKYGGTRNHPKTGVHLQKRVKHPRPIHVQLDQPVGRPHGPILQVQTLEKTLKFSNSPGRLHQRRNAESQTRVLARAGRGQKNQVDSADHRTVFGSR